jgi:hypothetical protein
MSSQPASTPLSPEHLLSTLTLLRLTPLDGVDEQTKNQSVSEMATEVLACQAGARARRTGESLVEALRAVLQTEAGRRLGQLRDGVHRDERAEQWQPSLSRERAEERRQEKLEERSRLREEERSRARKAAWESFMRKERRDLELRKEGQLAELLGEALAGEPPAALRRLAREDQRQAEEGLVALTSIGQDVLQARRRAHRRGYGGQDRG